MIDPDKDGPESTLTAIDPAPKRDKSPIYDLNSSASHNPEVFLISGLSGQVFPFKRCARMVSDELKVTGLLFPHLVGDTSRYRTIKATADYFHDIVAASQRNYVLVFGFSKGGAIAFELARRLSDEGQSVGLILFDTSVRSLQVKANPIRFALEDLAKAISRGFDKLGAMLSGELAHRARLDSIAAMQSFRPAPSDVPTVLLRPRIRNSLTRFVPTHDLGWGSVCNLLAVLETDGTHLNAFKGEHATEFCAAWVKAARILEESVNKGVQKEKGADPSVAAQ